MKRPFWLAQESLRHLESELPVQHPNETIRLHSMSLCAENRLPASTSSLRSASCSVSALPAAGDFVVNGDPAQRFAGVAASAPHTHASANHADCVEHESEEKRDLVLEGHKDNVVFPDKATVQLTADSFYDDWLHRGCEEPVRHMNHYIYGMYVRRRPFLEALSQGFDYCSFDAHYARGEGFVQEILYAPQVPYLHGLTMPTDSSNSAINALCHSVLLQPTRCPRKSCCRDIVAHSKRYIDCPSSPDTCVWHGFARPTRNVARRDGAARFI